MTREEAIKLLENDEERPCTDECCASFTCEECKFFQALNMALDALKKERPHGEWIVNNRYKRKGKTFLDCSVCHYGENGDVICEVKEIPRFCPSCSAIMDGRR